MASCLPSAHLTKVVQSWFDLASASTMLGAELGQQREVINIGRHIRFRDGAIQHKCLKRAGEMTEHCGISACTWQEDEWC